MGNSRQVSELTPPVSLHALTVLYIMRFIVCDTQEGVCLLVHNL